MNCKNCGCELQAADTFCPSCGKPITVTMASSPSPVESTEQTQAPETLGIKPAVSRKAKASLIFGLLALIITLPASIAAIVLGHMSLSEIKRSMGRVGGEAVAIGGLVLGYTMLAMSPVIFLIVLAIARPSIVRARITANETSAARSVRMIVAAEDAYRMQHPEVGYTCDLQALSQTASGGVIFIDQELASGTKHAYRFTLSGCKMLDGSGTESEGVAVPPATTTSASVNAFQVAAEPTRGVNSVYMYCSDQTGVVHRLISNSVDDCLSNGVSIP